MHNVKKIAGIVLQVFAILAFFAVLVYGAAIVEAMNCADGITAECA